MHKRFGLLSALALSLAAACSGGDDDNGATPDAATGGFPDADTSATIDASPPGDSAPPPDAAPSALGCIGATLPATVADPPIVISGTVQEATINGGIQTMTQSAHVSAHLVVDGADDTLLIEDDFTGDFSLTDPTDSTTPLDAYLKATSTDFVDTYVYPPYAIFENLANTPIIMVSETIASFLPALTGIAKVDGTGVLIVAVVDCDQASVEGAVVSITPPAGTIKYAGSNGVPTTDDYPATQSSGIAYIFNVPPGTYTIGASKSGMDLRDNAVDSFADSNTTLVVAP